ncbi:tail assembly chaperone [Ruegeria phage DSS3-P1]|uniref:tail assembly chaperone n=1 Tax=Ruegeria phage DSS3-P1 TaxID=1555208 RepID=UPI0002357D42|nr:tail assembly chaperone [Ruegeria phage DSS3-P1]YP_009997262.1 tail assembly chaperone [Ruegeria phage vB_RpoS-V18]YP_009997344.1 tail assembly chaperone [Ruegeria phage vB_RpoS-V11]YP_009997427.1 tail assembly chaperone [Ruegeria phage vB_RpoS-V7]AET42300.1 hypothetical protein SDSG_00034 [Ruegeria phage DSS3-P1]AIT13280.1 hypothetical protein DSS3P1_45 [Ruegeria phage DSS3-P1]AWY08749.1 hypothetical protein vBRpoSV7_46 [Ruegeria phage vB_RpoS-V7]AWY08921.1 hypothetical protein vBRpoSV18
MPLPFIASLLIGVALQVVGYLLMPKPKQPRPPSLEDFKEPTAEAGRPIPVVFGSITVQSPNNLGHWDKEVVTRHIKSSKK